MVYFREQLLAPSRSSFPLSVEEDGCHRKPQLVLLCKLPRVEAVPRSRGPHHLPLLLLEENEHEPVDPDVRPWHLIRHHIFPCTF